MLAKIYSQICPKVNYLNRKQKGCETFILPPQITKQSPEVWARIVERHKISCLISRAREFSLATQIQDFGPFKGVLSLRSLKSVVLLGTGSLLFL